MKPVDVQFRQATKEDRSGILALLSARQLESNSLHGTSGNAVPVHGDRLFSEMLSNPNVRMIAGTIDGRTVATLTIHLLPQIRKGGYYAIFEDVLVAEDFRRQGIGSRLLMYAIDLCRQDKRIKKIKLGSRKDAEEVHTFYEKAGFEYKEKLFQLPL